MLPNCWKQEEMLRLRIRSGIRIRGVMIETECLVRFEAARMTKTCLK